MRIGQRALSLIGIFAAVLSGCSHQQTVLNYVHWPPSRSWGKDSHRAMMDRFSSWLEEGEQFRREEDLVRQLLQHRPLTILVGEHHLSSALAESLATAILKSSQAAGMEVWEEGMTTGASIKTGAGEEWKPLLVGLLSGRPAGQPLQKSGIPFTTVSGGSDLEEQFRRRLEISTPPSLMVYAGNDHVHVDELFDEGPNAGRKEALLCHLLRQKGRHPVAIQTWCSDYLLERVAARTLQVLLLALEQGTLSAEELLPEVDRLEQRYSKADRILAGKANWVVKLKEDAWLAVAHCRNHEPAYSELTRAFRLIFREPRIQELLSGPRAIRYVKWIQRTHQPCCDLRERWHRFDIQVPEDGTLLKAYVDTSTGKVEYNLGWDND